MTEQKTSESNEGATREIALKEARRRVAAKRPAA